jgi:tRNA/tmRNA/rRNA uracil-C5-methylase (TrmA/RlmC/RlmD family)
LWGQLPLFFIRHYINQRPAEKRALIAEITKRLPQVKSIMQNINGEKTSLIFGKETRHMHGEEYIQDYKRR